VNHRIDSSKRARECFCIADVAYDKLDVSAEILGTPSLRAVNLGNETVQSSHSISVRQQFIGDVSAYESSASGNQYSWCHPGLFLCS
jgi:hypothetical protein